jgi:hypothetical protein
MVMEGVLIGHRICGRRVEVDHIKIDAIEKLLIIASFFFFETWVFPGLCIMTMYTAIY